MTAALAHAKLNLALVVGPRRPDGKHEVVTVLQRLELADTIELEPSDDLRVEGFVEDTIVRRSLEALAAAAGVRPQWTVRLDKQVPVAAGLGGGSSDAATALRLANASLATPLEPTELHALAARRGADVPFFLAEGPQLGSGDGSTLEPLEVRQDYVVVLVLPDAESKSSTADVYERFDHFPRPPETFGRRRADLLAALERGDLAALPPNDLASSPLADELRHHGAFRADVSGAGPTVYGLFDDERDAAAASAALTRFGRTWITRPAW